MTTNIALQIHHGHDQNTPVITGCPFPADADLSQGAKITFADGSVSDAQAVALTNTMSNATRWWELSFLSKTEGRAEVDPVGSGNDSKNLATESGSDIILDNGLVKATLCADPVSAPAAISWSGGEGKLTPEILTDKLGKCLENKDSKRQLKILRNGPIRTQVELCGDLTGDGGAIDYRLTIEMWQGLPAVRVDWMLTHRVAGVAEFIVKKASLTGNWQVGENPQRVFLQRGYSAAGNLRDVFNPAPVTLIADHSAGEVHVADPAMLLDDEEYPFYCTPPNVGTGEWLELQGSSGRISAQLVDFTQTRPNAFFSSESELSYHLVPEGEGLKWCQGWRKEQNLLLSFASSDDDLSPGQLAAKAADAFPLGKAQPSAETMRDTASFDLDRILPYIPGQNLRLSALLDQLCQLSSRGEKMDLGDTPDWHYTRIYATSSNQYMPLGNMKDFPRYFGAPQQYVFPDPMKFFMEPAWTNNEYDMIHALATEVMRTGKDDHFTMLRWAARHNVEIDFLSYSDDPWHHRASPFHSHFHNRKGAITSHFWTQGLLQYYCLTGDRDALETALALGDKIIELNNDAVARVWKFDREIGWALLALCCLAEAGFSDYENEAKTIAEFLCNYDRKNFSGAVNLSAGKAGRGLERQMIDNGFGYSPMVEALDRYQKLRHNKEQEVWFIQLLHDIKDSFWQKIDEGETVTVRSMVGLVLTIGYERTGEKDFLTAARLVMEVYMDPALSSAASVGISASAGTEGAQAKPCAMAYRGLHRMLGALAREGELDRFEYPARLEHEKG